MIYYTAAHELLRLHYRIWALENGWQLVCYEKLVESPYFVGYTDDIFRLHETMMVTEYSKGRLKLHKVYDAALSAGYVRFVEGTEVEAELVTEQGVVNIQGSFIEHTWDVAENLGALMEQEDNGLLGIARACYLCPYCTNRECSNKPGSFD